MLVFNAFIKQQGCKEPCKIKKKCHNFGKFRIYLERLKYSTQSKHNCVKTIDVIHNAKRYRASQVIIGSWKMYFFSINSKFYDEERNELS